MSTSQADLDVFSLRDESLEASDNLPDPEVIAGEIAENLRVALSLFEEVAADLAADGMRGDGV